MQYEWDKTIKWIPGYEGTYAVTIDGKAASYTCHPNAGGEPVWLTQRWRGGRCGRKYLAVTLCIGDKKKSRPVHQLVLEAFDKPRPSDMLALHKDDNPANNHLDNLYWGTTKQNIQDAKRNGRIPQCKLSEQDVWHIHELRAQGRTHRAIADLVGIARETVRDILKGDNWPEVRDRFLATKGGGVAIKDVLNGVRDIDTLFEGIDPKVDQPRGPAPKEVEETVAAPATAAPAEAKKSGGKKKAEAPAAPVAPPNSIES